MRDHLDRGIVLAIAQQFLAGEALMHFAGAVPGDDLHLGLAGDIGARNWSGSMITVGASRLSTTCTALDEVQQMSTSAFTSAEVLT